MGDVAVFKAAHHFGNGVGLADMAEEFVAQAFTFGGALHKACNIDKLHARRNNAFGMV